MSTAKVYLNRINAMINNIRYKYPNITDDMLLENGAIFYNNIEGTTDCWEEHRILPRFEVYYKGGDTFISLQIKSDSTANAYVTAYTDSLPIKAVLKPEVNVSPFVLCKIMKIISDNRGRYNAPIHTLDWNIETVRY